MAEYYEVTPGPAKWDFVPEFGDGLITVHLRQLTVEEMEDCINVFVANSIDRKKMVLLGVEKIYGLKIKGKIINDVEGLLTGPKELMPLFAEIWLQLQKGSTVSEDEEKKS